MQTRPRDGASIDRIYLHTNEGPQADGAAISLGGYLDRIDAGYHVIVDQGHTILKAGDQQVVWAEGGDNTHCLSICMIGYSASTDWNSDYSKAMVERAAQQAAAWCKAYGIPARRVHPGAPGQPPVERGIAEHADDHDPSSQGHTDPGARFPIDLFCMRVQEILTPHVDWQAIAKLTAWAKAVSMNPLVAGSTRPDVSTAKALLAKAGFDVGNRDPLYGQAFVGTVHEFKVMRGLSNVDGTKLGAEVVKSLGL